MNKLTNLAGIVGLSLASLISGCKKDVEGQKMTEPNYVCLLEIMNDKGDLIKIDTLIYPILFKGSIVFDKNDISGPYTLQGYFHLGPENRIIYHPNK